jgi:serine/threonine-protein kinase
MPILTPEERIGQRIVERYRLDAVISSGGMGVLFRAFDEATGAPVAVKMLKPSHLLEADRIARFMRETRIASALHHPNLVRVLDVRTDESGIPFLIMELLEGRSLAQELDERGTLPLADALALTIPVASALATVHAMGVIHRDIKPSNIFLCRDSDGATIPKLLDFGIARGAKDDFETDTGLLLGTPGYMAPERVQYSECSSSTDIWGVGAVIYRCLVGHPPHAGCSVQEMLSRLVREPVPPLAPLGIGRQACATIERSLARDPHQRYATMAAFGSALRALLDPEGDAEGEHTLALEGAQVAAMPDTIEASPDASSARIRHGWPFYSNGPRLRRRSPVILALLVGCLLLASLAFKGSGRAGWRAADDARTGSLAMSADLALHQAAASTARIQAQSPASQIASSLASARPAAGEEPDALRPVAPDTVTAAGQPLPSVASARTASGARSLHLLSSSGRNEESAHPRHSKHGDAPPPDPMDHRR